jgi:murein DD-endopeptidase MepM/ murein hydrolase activator NlpD
MALNRYTYNPKTCQFEPAPVRAGSIVVYLAGLAITAAALFAAMLAVENKVVVTEVERELRTENAALRKHGIVLANELTIVRKSLDEIGQLDGALHNQLFHEPRTNSEDAGLIRAETFLQADPSQFDKLYQVISETARRELNTSVEGNASFARDLVVGPADIRRFKSFPTYLPVAHPGINRIASGFGMRINPFHKGLYPHTGIDFAASRGTEVVASGSGRVSLVRYSDLQAGYGNMIEIDHGDGIVTRYAHLEQFFVREGQRVAGGQAVGTVGITGGAVAPHLHYEMLIGGRQVDPVPYLIEGFTADGYASFVRQSKAKNQSLD